MTRQAFASDISRDEFEQIRPMLEAARRRTRPRKHDLYDVFCAVMYFISTATPWRNMPPEFPPWRTVHEYFSQWSTARGGQMTLLEQALRALNRMDDVHRLRSRIGPR